MSAKLGVALYVIALAVGLFSVSETTSRPWDAYELSLPDGIADKYLTVAAWDGSGTGATMDELADRYDLADSSVPSEVTRTPGTFVLQAPLMLVPDAAVVPLLAVSSVLGVLAACWAASRLSRLPLWATGSIAVMVVTSPQMMWAYYFGTTSVVVAGLIAWSWAWKVRPSWAGALLGVAIVLKVWPALLLIPLMRRSKATTLIAVAWAGGLTLAGLLLPGTALAVAGGWMFWVDFRTNWSLVRFIGLPAALTLGAVVMLASWRLSDDRRIAVAILVGLAVSPLSWAWYWVAAIPAVAVLLRRRVEVGRPVHPEKVVVDLGEAGRPGLVRQNEAHEVGA